MEIAQFTALIGTIDDNGLNTALEVRTILEAIRDSTFVMHEVKVLNIPSADMATYLTANYDGTGLGIGNSVGFAICNGNNGTEDYRRRVPVGYDPTTYVSGNNYSLMGNAFGEENHVLTIPELPAHDHGGTKIETGLAGTDPGFASTDSENSVGGDEAHNNMQPSIVTLFIQRVS